MIILRFKFLFGHFTLLQNLQIEYTEVSKLYLIKVKGKAVPLQAWSGPEGSRKLRFPDFMTTAQDVGKVVSLTHRPALLPRNIYLVLTSVRGWVDPGSIVRPEGLCHWKIPMTASGIEPATCRCVARFLNHYSTARLQIIPNNELIAPIIKHDPEIFFHLYIKNFNLS